MTDKTGSPDRPPPQENPRALADGYGRLSPLTVLACIAIGAFALLFFGLEPSDPTVQYCDHERMQPGDACLVVSGEGSGTYEELVAEDTKTIWVGPATAITLTVLAAVVLVSAIVAWRRDARVRSSLAEVPLVVAASRKAGSPSFALIAAFGFLTVTSFLVDDLVVDPWNWMSLVILLPGGLAIATLVSAWPRRGALVQVGEDDTVTVIVAGRQRQAPIGETTVRLPTRQGGLPTLWHGGSRLMTIDRRLLGRDDVMRVIGVRAFAQGA